MISFPFFLVGRFNHDACVNSLDAYEHGTVVFKPLPDRK
jgi:hypothetical protein